MGDRTQGPKCSARAHSPIAPLRLWNNAVLEIINASTSNRVFDQCAHLLHVVRVHLVLQLGTFAFETSGLNPQRSSMESEHETFPVSRSISQAPIRRRLKSKDKLSSLCRSRNWALFSSESNSWEDTSVSYKHRIY